MGDIKETIGKLGNDPASTIMDQLHLHIMMHIVLGQWIDWPSPLKSADVCKCNEYERGWIRKRMWVSCIIDKL